MTKILAPHVRKCLLRLVAKEPRHSEQLGTFREAGKRNGIYIGRSNKFALGIVQCT